MRKFQFETEKYYHVFNRGVDKRPIFVNENDYSRFLFCLHDFNTIAQVGSLTKLERRRRHPEPPSLEAPDASAGLVNIICYCLIQNHYHMILKQVHENGISKFLQKVGMGYSNYFNIKYNRSGSLFQGKFKAAAIKTDEKLLELSFYVNGNHEIHGLGQAEAWRWSSCQDYLGMRDGTLCKKEIILREFSGVDEYERNLRDYVADKKQWKDENRDMFLE